MYGRTALNIRDGIEHVLRNPDELITAPFILGTDIIEAALHYYGGMPYHEPSAQRNNARIDAVVNLWNADSLVQREAVLTCVGSVLLFSRMSGVARAPVRGYQLASSCEVLGLAVSIR